MLQELMRHLLRIAQHHIPQISLHKFTNTKPSQNIFRRPLGLAIVWDKSLCIVGFAPWLEMTFSAESNHKLGQCQCQKEHLMTLKHFNYKSLRSRFSIFGVVTSCLSKVVPSVSEPFPACSITYSTGAGISQPARPPMLEIATNHSSRMSRDALPGVDRVCINKDLLVEFLSLPRLWG